MGTKASVKKALAAARKSASRSPIDTSEWLQAIALLIDECSANGYVAILEEAIGMADGVLLGPHLSESEQGLTHYFLGNAWSSMSRHTDDKFGWMRPDLEKQIVHFRLATRFLSVVNDPQERIRLCQAYTNLGTLFNHIGRPYEAIGFWNDALRVMPSFGMALGNRGHGLFFLARILQDPGHQAIYLREAYKAFQASMVPAASRFVYEDVRHQFADLLKHLEEKVPKRVLLSRPRAYSYPKRISIKERTYRDWCLSNGLFLNDLNDIDCTPLAAADMLTLPALRKPISASVPYEFALFNQLKQEYASARFLCFEGLSYQGLTHFSDRDVKLANTLDYSAYGYRLEQVRISYRVAYSILDKIAYFLNDYLDLGIPEKRVSFRSIWYVKQEPKGQLRDEFKSSQNWILRGLFWLSKDLYEERTGFIEAIEPQAREKATIRNHLEHKFLRLHLWESAWNESQSNDPSLPFFPLLREDFEKRTVEILRLVRHSLMYLSLALTIEEDGRQRPDNDALTMKFDVTTLEDDWKR